MNSIYFSSTDSYQAHGICQNKNNKIAHNVFQHLGKADLGFFYPLTSFHKGENNKYICNDCITVNKQIKTKTFANKEKEFDNRSNRVFFLSSEKSFLNSWPIPGVYSNYVSTSIEFRAQQLAPNQPGGIFNKNKRIHPALLVYRGLFVQHNTLKTPSGSSFDHIINDLQSVVPRVIPAAKVFCRFPIIDRSNNSTRCFTNIFFLLSFYSLSRQKSKMHFNLIFFETVI